MQCETYETRRARVDQISASFDWPEVPELAMKTMIDNSITSRQGELARIVCSIRYDIEDDKSDTPEHGNNNTQQHGNAKCAEKLLCPSLVIVDVWLILLARIVEFPRPLMRCTSPTSDLSRIYVAPPE